MAKSEDSTAAPYSPKPTSFPGRIPRWVKVVIIVLAISTALSGMGCMFLSLALVGSDDEYDELVDKYTEIKSKLIEAERANLATGFYASFGFALPEPDQLAAYKEWLDGQLKSLKDSFLFYRRLYQEQVAKYPQDPGRHEWYANLRTLAYNRWAVANQQAKEAGYYHLEDVPTQKDVP